MTISWGGFLWRETLKEIRQMHTWEASMGAALGSPTPKAWVLKRALWL